MMAKRPISYAVLRGKVIETDLIEFGGRGGDITFLAPDPHKIADQIPVASPRLLEDLYTLSLEDILDYLDELGTRLRLEENPYLQEALEYSYDTAPTTKPIMDSYYHDLPFMFDKQRIRDMVDFTIGIDYLEGWVQQQVHGCNVGIRAYGARTLHIVAGNGPVLPSLETVKNGRYTPLSRPIFIYVSNAAAGRTEVVEFVEFYLKNAANLVQDVGYIPLQAAEYEQQLKKFRQFMTEIQPAQ